MAEYYAQALWKMVERGDDPVRAVSALRHALARSGRSALLPKIARAFARMAQRVRVARGSVLSVAHHSDILRAEQAARAALRAEGVQLGAYAVRVDEGLIGGWRIESGGLLIDASYKRYLMDMYQRIINA